MGLTPVIGFLNEQGIDVLAPSLEEIVDLLSDSVETDVSDNPFRVNIIIRGETRGLEVSLDDELNVVTLDQGAFI